jgi:hypothetical protein
MSNMSNKDENLRALSQQLVGYLAFRAEKDGGTYSYEEKDFYSALQAGEREFFGIICDDERIVGDGWQPDIFRDWQILLRARKWMMSRGKWQA